MKLNVLGQRVTVISRKDLRLEESADGIYYALESKIELDKSLNKDEKLRALLHEMVHAVCARLGLSSTGVSSDVEEILCEGVANVIADNINVIKSLR